MSRDRIILCGPAPTCRDPHTLRWYCMRGHALDDRPAVPGVCPIRKCETADAREGAPS